MWNVKTGRVCAIDGIVFHAEYDRDANLVERVTPSSETQLGLVTVRGSDRPMEWESESSPKTWGIEDDEPVVALEELLPIRVHHIIEPEPEGLDVVGVITTRQHSEVVLADPESSQSDTTDSPPESDCEEEVEVESSDRDGGGSDPSDLPRGSTSVPEPVAAFDRMDDSDDPASAPAVICLLYTSPSPRD